MFNIVTLRVSQTPKLNNIYGEDKKTKKAQIQTTHLYEEAKIRLKELKQIHNEKMEALLKAPVGKIHIVKSNNRIQYYLRKNTSDKMGEYMSVSQKPRIKEYLQKSYDEKVLKILSKEINNLELFLKNSNDAIYQIQEIYSSYPNKIKEQIKPIDISDEDYISEWLQKKYESKKISDDTPVYISDKGERVRSKSELNIANALYKNSIPYKYECPLKLKNGFVIYPDFTVLDVANRKIVYWEHRGMMDDREYAKHAVMRIKDYNKNDIYLGRNLIITEETASVPLSTKEIEEIIKEYFAE